MKKSVFTREYAILRDELVRIRQDAQLTQRELAKRLKVAHSWVAKVESGDRRLDLVEFHWLVDACGEQPAAVLKRILNIFARTTRQNND